MTCGCGYWAGENEAVGDSAALEKAGALAAPVTHAAEGALGRKTQEAGLTLLGRLRSHYRSYDLRTRSAVRRSKIDHV